MFGRKAIYLGSEWFLLLTFTNRCIYCYTCILSIACLKIWRFSRSKKKRKLVVFLLFFCCTQFSFYFNFYHLRFHCYTRSSLSHTSQSDVFHTQKELETPLVSSFFGALDISICTCLVGRLYKVSLAFIFVQNRSYLLTFTIFTFTIILVVYLTTPNLAFFHAPKKKWKAVVFLLFFCALK